MLERLLRTLLHPKLTMTAIAMLHLHAAIVTFVYKPATLTHPQFWASVSLFAAAWGGCALLWIDRKWVVTFAGATLVGVAFCRGFALVAHLMDPDISQTARVTASVSIAQWFTIGYLTFVIWRRLVVPFSVLEQTDRRAVPR
jgi:hypothetical protein